MSATAYSQDDEYDEGIIALGNPNGDVYILFLCLSPNVTIRKIGSLNVTSAIRKSVSSESSSSNDDQPVRVPGRKSRRDENKSMDVANHQVGNFSNSRQHLRVLRFFWSMQSSLEPEVEAACEVLTLTFIRRDQRAQLRQVQLRDNGEEGAAERKERGGRMWQGISKQQVPSFVCLLI